jgi:hypothetical protein
MQFDLGFLTIKWNKREPKPKQTRGRPPALTDRDRWDRAEDAACWILRRYWMGAPYSRRRRPRYMTEQAYNHGYRLLHLAELMYEGEMLYAPRQSETAMAALRLTVHTIKERYLRQKKKNPYVVLPF